MHPSELGFEDGDRIRRILKPTWAQVEDVIRGMDGQRNSHVTIGYADEIYMSIGGGTNGIYVCEISEQNKHFFDLIDPAKSAHRSQPLMVAQLGDWPEDMCVDLNRVLRAAKTFFHTRRPDAALVWRER